MIDFFSIKLGLFDICLLSILILSGIVGYNNGFIKEILSVLIWLISIFSTFLFLDEFLYVTFQYIDSKTIANIISFIIPFCLLFLTFTILFKLLFNNLNDISNSFVNNFVGFLFGIFKGGIFIIFCIKVLIYLFNTTENFPLIISNSYFFEPVKNIAVSVLEYII